MLESKADLCGRDFIRTGRFEPSRQVCSACGVKDGPKPLYIRVWQCHGCGAVLDPDINAAVNVALAAGLAVSACRAQVGPGSLGPAQREEAGTHRTPGGGHAWDNPTTFTEDTTWAVEGALGAVT